MFIPSGQIAKSLPLKSKDGDITAEKRDNVNTGGMASKPDVEIKVDGAEEGKEEELLSTVSWDQPKRLVNLSSNNYHEILFRLFRQLQVMITAVLMVHNRVYMLIFLGFRESDYSTEFHFQLAFIALKNASRIDTKIALHKKEEERNSLKKNNYSVSPYKFYLTKSLNLHLQH